MLIELIRYAFVALIAMGVFLAIGRTILGFFIQIDNRYYRTFIHLATGTLVATVLFAIVQSGGKTILMVQLPVFLVAFWLNRKHVKPFSFDFREFLKDWKITVVALLPIFIYESYFYFDWSNGTYKSLFIDSYYYSSFSNSLKLWGSESKNIEMNYFYPDCRLELVPYHYPELWLTALVSIIFGIGLVSSYAIIVVSILISISLIGIISIFSGIAKMNLVNSYLISIFCLFISGLFLKYYETSFLKDYHHWSESSLLSNISAKSAFVYIFMLWIIILLYEENYIHALLVSTIIPTLSLIFIPSIGGIFCSAWLWSFRKIGFSFKGKGLLLLSLMIFVLISFATFYSIFKSNYTSDFAIKGSFIGKILRNEFSLVDLKIFVGNGIYWAVVIIILNLPLTIPIIVGFRGFKPVIIIVFSGVLVGIIASCLFFPVMDGSQFASSQVILVPIITILGLAEIIRNFILIKRPILITTILLLIGSVSYSTNNFIRQKIGNKNNLSQDSLFLNKIKEILNSNQEVILVYLGDNDFKNLFFPQWGIKNSIMNLPSYTDRNLIFTLGNPERYFELNPAPKPEELYYYEFLTPIRFWKRNKTTFKSKDFVKYFNIRLVYCKSGSIPPPFIKDWGWKEIESQKTGDRFYYHK